MPWWWWVPGVCFFLGAMFGTFVTPVLVRLIQRQH